MDAKTMRGGWGEAEIVWFESGCVICRAADHAEAIGHRPQAIPVDGMFSVCVSTEIRLGLTLLYATL